MEAQEVSLELDTVVELGHRQGEMVEAGKHGEEFPGSDQNQRICALRHRGCDQLAIECREPPAMLYRQRQ